MELERIRLYLQIKIILKAFKTFLFATILFATLLFGENTYCQNYIYSSSISEGLSAPTRLAVDNQGNVYVTDTYQKNIIKFDASGNFLEIIETTGTPISIAINNDNLIVFGDSENGKIVRLETDGTETVIFSDSIYPTSMVFSNDNLLYVVESFRKRVVVMDLNGNIKRTIGNDILIFPTGIAFDNKNKRILVAEHGGDDVDIDAKIWVFNVEGDLINNYGSYGSGDGEFYRIQGLTIGNCGNIYVTDPFQSNVSVFDATGNFIRKFASYGVDPGQLNVPMDLIFDSQQRLLITSMNNGSLEIYSITDSLPTSNIICTNTSVCVGETAEIFVNFTGTAPWNFTYTIDGINSVEINSTFDNPYIITASEPGLYELTSLSDANYTGTCFTGIAEISISPLPSANISSEPFTICESDTVNIPISFTGVSPWSVTYTINGQNPVSIDYIYDNPYNLKATKAGIYEITELSGANCSGTNFTGSATINKYTTPTASFVSENDSIAMCYGDTAVLLLEFTGEAPWAFSYSINDTVLTHTSEIYDNSYNFTSSQAGIHKVTSISDNNCTSSVIQDYFEVFINTPSLEDEINICAGEIYTLDPGFGFLSYLWNDESTSQTLSVNASGSYSVTVIDSVGCEYSDSILVSINPIPSSSIISNDAWVCTGDSTDIIIGLTGTPSWSFSYTVDGKNPSTVSNITESPYHLNVSEAGIYEITSLFDANCAGTIDPESTEIIIIPLPVAHLGEDVNICDGEVLTVDAGPNYVYYLWNDESFDQELNIISSGYYSVTVTDANDCSDSDTVLVTVNLKSIADFSYTSNNYSALFFNNSLNASSYNWTFGDTQTSNEVNPAHTYLASGEYIVTLIAANEYCDNSTISKNINISIIGVESIAIESAISIYPNPSSGHITLELDEHFQSDFIIEIISFTGQKVYRKEIKAINRLEEIDLSPYSKGIYTLKLIFKEQTKIAKLILSN